MRKSLNLLCSVLVVILIVFVSSFSISLQERKSDSKNNDDKLAVDAKSKLKKEKAEAFEQMLGEVRGTQPEILSYVLFELIESGTLDDKNRKIEILEELFDLAYSTKYPVKRVDSYQDTDTSSGQLDHAYSLNLDRLSIQCRTVNKLIGLDKKKARDYFKKVSYPGLKSLSCEEPLIYDVSAYYDLLSSVINQTFTEQEIKQREHIFLIEQAILGINSPVELAPAMRVIASLKIPQTDLLIVVGVLSKKMSELSSDARSLHWALRSLGEEVKKLATYCKDKELSPDGLLESYRVFLVSNMSKNWCNDYKDKSKIAKLIQKEADLFNGTLVSIYGDSSKVLPIEIKEIAPKGLDGGMKIQFYWESPTGQLLFKGIQKLNYEGRTKRSTSEKEQKTWESNLSEYYHVLSSWKKEGAISEIDYFHQKAALMGFLLQITPKTNSQYSNILSDTIAFLAQDRSHMDNTSEWLWEALAPIKRMEYDKQSPKHILMIYLESNNISLQAIAKTKLFIEKYRKKE